jgi:hypothetical protein
MINAITEEKIIKYGWQILLIVSINIVGLLYYLDMIPFIYSLYRVSAFEIIIRCLFSDLIAYSERNNRNYPFIWWIVAFLFPPVTLFYIYFFPFKPERNKDAQYRNDICFAVACLSYRLIPALYGLLA